MPGTEAAVLGSPRFEALVEEVCPPQVTGLGIAPRVVADALRLVGVAAPATRLALRAALGASAAGLPIPRQLGTAVRDLLVTVAYEQPEVHAALGYDPDPWVARTAALRAERWGPEIRGAAEELLRSDPLVPGASPGRRPGRFVSSSDLPPGDL